MSRHHFTVTIEFELPDSPEDEGACQPECQGDCGGECDEIGYEVLKKAINWDGISELKTPVEWYSSSFETVEEG